MIKAIWLRALVLFILLACGVQAMDAAPGPTSDPGSAAATRPTIEQVQAKLAALATLSDLPESERTQARELYQQALSQLQAAQNYADTLASYQQLQTSAKNCHNNWRKPKSV